jgi:hypothetical protein
MAQSFAVVRQACPTSTGTQNFTKAGFGTPVGYIVIANLCEADGTEFDDLSGSFGFSDFTNQVCFTYSADDASARSDVDSETDDAAVCRLHDPGTAGPDDEAVGVDNGTVTNGIQIDWTTVPSTGKLVTVILIGGDVSNCHVGTQVLSDDTAHDITAPGFQPKVVFLASSHALTIPGSATGGALAIGFAFDNGVSTEQASLALWETNNAADATIGIHMDTANALLSIEAIGTETFHECNVGSWDANGFTITTTTTGIAPTSTELGYICFDLGGLDAWVGTDTHPSSGSKSVSDPGFTPQFLFTLDSLITTADANQTDDQASGFHIGVSDDSGSPATSFANHLRNDNGAATTDTGSLSDDAYHTRVLTATGGQAIRAAIASWDDGAGWTFDYDTNPIGPRYFAGFAVQAPTSIDQFVPAFSRENTPPVPEPIEVVSYGEQTPLSNVG